MEIETKLDVHPAFVLPDLAGAVADAEVIDQGEATLRATYWDTEDLRLARSGVTLRHRRSGGTGSWQVKKGGDGDGDGDSLSRAELDFPGGPTRPPRAVREQVAVAARGGALVPVARLRTRRRTLAVRRGDATVAEVVDDEVSIIHEGRIASRFRELEVELGPAGTARDRRSLVATLTAEGAHAADQIPKVMRALGPAAEAPDDLQRIADPVVAALLGTRLERLRSVDPAARRDEPGAAGQLADLLEELAIAVDLLTSPQQLEDDGSWLPPTGRTPEASVWLAAAAASRDVAVVDQARATLAEVLDDVRQGLGEHVPLRDDAARALDTALADRREAARAVLCERLSDEAYVDAAAGVTEAAVTGALRARGDGAVAAAQAWRASADDGTRAPHFAVAVQLAAATRTQALGRLPARAARFASAARSHETARRALHEVVTAAAQLSGPAAFAAGLAAAGLCERAGRLREQVAAAREDADGKRLRRLLDHGDDAS